MAAHVAPSALARSTNRVRFRSTCVPAAICPKEDLFTRWCNGAGSHMNAHFFAAQARRQGPDDGRLGSDNRVRKQYFCCDLTSCDSARTDVRLDASSPPRVVANGLG